MPHMDNFNHVIGFDHLIENLEAVLPYNHSADAWNARVCCRLRMPANEFDRRIDRREHVNRALRTSLD
jgi:hypothetical protein